MPKYGFKVITVSQRVYDQLELLAAASGYTGHGAIPKFLEKQVCGFRKGRR